MNNATINGKIEDVAAFFRVHVQTVHKWRRKRLIGSWKEGGNICFGEADVVKRWVEHYAQTRKLSPGEAEEMARTQWRAHLQERVESSEQKAKIPTDIEQRLRRLEVLAGVPFGKELQAA